MGMRDSEEIYSTAQAVTATGDTASTNVYDAGSANNSDISMTERLWINATVNTAFTSGGSATIQAVLQDSADNATFADALAGPVVAVANATEGTVLLETQPPVGLRRYTRLAYRIGTAVMTAGAVDGYISSTIQRNIARPSGFAA